MILIDTSAWIEFRRGTGSAANLIAAVAIRHDVPVLHFDIDFEVLERHTALRTD